MPDAVIDVDVSRVLRKVEPRTIGININYLVDHDENRPAGARPLEDALREMGVRSLRFPGGDKSDNHLWSVPPFDRPRPALACGPREGREQVLQTPAGDWTVRRMDFDEFMVLCRRLGAEPTVVVCYDALYHPRCEVSKQRLIETAAAWVEYANVKRAYGVKYWEIGNEAYIEENITAAEYARDVVDFARAMKEVDPSILIGANGPDAAQGRRRHAKEGEPPWWQVMFETAGEHIDVAVVHIYPCYEWGSYEAYRARLPEVARQANAPLEAARRWGPAGLADRLRVTVTEHNAADWSKGGWPFVNDIGHALVTFDIVGTLLEQERVDMAQLWNTRWVSHPPDARSLWDAVDDMNRLQPSGEVLATWSRYVKERMVSVSDAPQVRSFASHTPSPPALSIFLISRSAAHQEVEVNLRGYQGPRSGTARTWRGEGPQDQDPVWSDPTEVRAAGDALALTLPPDSLTVVELA